LDTSVQQGENGVIRDFRTLDNYHCSVDVSKCLLPRTETPQGDSGKRPVDSIYGILLEKQYLYGVLNDNMVKGELKFYDILQTILEDIVRATGRVNDLQLQYYENFRTFRIVDRNFTNIEKEYPSISIFGKNSFTKQVNLASRLTPEISTMLAIAAQDEPTSNGIQGTAFKEFNKNQTDRIIEIRQDPDTPKRDRSEIQQQFASVFQYLFIVYGRDQNRADREEYAEALDQNSFVNVTPSDHDEFIFKLSVHYNVWLYDVTFTKDTSMNHYIALGVLSDIMVGHYNNDEHGLFFLSYMDSYLDEEYTQEVLDDFYMVLDQEEIIRKAQLMAYYAKHMAPKDSQAHKTYQLVLRLTQVALPSLSIDDESMGLPAIVFLPNDRVFNQFVYSGSFYHSCYDTVTNLKSLEKDAHTLERESEKTETLIRKVFDSISD